MTPEAKKQLEEMANSYPAYYEMRFMNADTPRLSGAEYLVHGYKAGAQAAWDLAVKHERERIAGLINFGVENMERFINHNSDLTIVCEWHRFAITQVKILKKAILNPPAPEVKE